MINKLMCKCQNPDLGLLIIRLGLAAVFIAHGLSKLSNMQGTIAFFASLGMGAFFAYLVAIVETLSGLAMLLGIWVETAGVLLAIIMIVAVFSVKFAKGFLGGFELETIILASALGIALSGPGKYALMKKQM